MVFLEFRDAVAFDAGSKWGHRLLGARVHDREDPRSTERRKQTRTLLHRAPLLLFAFAAAAGVIVDAGVGPTMQAALGVSRVVAVWIPAALVTVLAALLSKSNRWVCLFLPMFPLAAAWHAVADAKFESASIRSILSQQPEPTVVIGWIDRPIVLRRHPLADSPSRRDQSPWQTQFELRLQQLRVGQGYELISGRLLAVSDGKLDQLLPGDRVEVFGSLREFAAPTNPGERDLRSVYRRRGLHGRIEIDGPDQIVRRGAPVKRDVHRGVAAVAACSRDLLMRHTSEPNRAIALALVLGQREFVDQSTRDLLLVTGTAHLLSVSGMHLAIVVVLASWTGLLLGLPLPVRVIWIITVCVLYTAITGGRPPVMRASILVATFMISMWIGRQGQPINTLSLAALILLAINPENVFSVGVQLSFLAVATLILCSGRSSSDSLAVERSLQREQRLHQLTEGALPKPLRYARWCGFYLRQAIWFSGCVTMTSIPLVWYQFHVVSFVSVLTNVVLAPCLFISLAAGVATVVAGWLYEPLAAVTGWVCDLGLTAMLRVIEFAAAIPDGHFWLPAPPPWWVAVFYVVLVVSLVWFGNSLAARLRRTWMVAWLGIAWWIATSPLPMDRLRRRSDLCRRRPWHQRGAAVFRTTTFGCTTADGWVMTLAAVATSMRHCGRWA